MRIGFELFRFRFVFRALDPISFAPGEAANTVRGALGKLLPDEALAGFFEPGSSGKGPSGLRDWPRPFVLRCSHLDGLSVAPGETFSFGIHVFETRCAVLPDLQKALEGLQEAGIGSGRGRAQLTRVEQLDFSEQCVRAGAPPSWIPLTPDSDASEVVQITFVTPTELKAGGALVERPDFPLLFGRLRDRICTLQALYGDGAWDLDFRAIGERARQVQLTRCDLNWEYAARKSSRTGQTHPLGGFTGEVEYRGPLGEFLPWLRAGRWVGVGRQTVWGKGEMHVLETTAPQKA